MANSRNISHVTTVTFNALFSLCILAGLCRIERSEIGSERRLPRLYHTPAWAFIEAKNSCYLVVASPLFQLEFHEHIKAKQEMPEAQSLSKLDLPATDPKNACAPKLDWTIESKKMALRSSTHSSEFFFIVMMTALACALQSLHSSTWDTPGLYRSWAFQWYYEI